ncbi:hypothetical protein TREMEDRAFT_62877 [Tremella mesenterica DSM 1558]|uniref:uncharacterized protein n=1 Tax=Tremella mesenterica (strain ATCC 24925 / CBS 8224 / DSM 1558 / NBRC 9311 / NRRL Y-6157 / RJB 2259-6 / UBC 559-6) TaxID=578456 RepID=UPI0003F49BEF|nr:uncharacterized protein TREMEDRAFT_62877 [Tremella mesenterica DSM 1558]EIW69149.1 hypothetical protein TREMEDRAFT_62877 [Tremella mesenterica DSM 1558]
MSTFASANFSDSDDEDADFLPSPPAKKRQRSQSVEHAHERVPNPEEMKVKEEEEKERRRRAEEILMAMKAEASSDQVLPPTKPSSSTILQIPTLSTSTVTGPSEKDTIVRSAQEPDVSEGSRSVNATEKDFQEGDKGDKKSAQDMIDKEGQVKIIEIKRPRRSSLGCDHKCCGGQDEFPEEGLLTQSETIQLRADDPEAIKYLSTEFTSTDDKPPKTSSTDTTTPGKSAKGRKKPRVSLETMAAAIDKGKKMTTLEKSQLDWKSHLSSDTSIHDELEANRRSGGYLQKRDFLDRVGERREEQLSKARR